MNRRNFITAAASTSIIAVLAGCSGSDDTGDTASGNGDDTGSNEDSTESTESNGENGEEESGSIEILDHEIVEPDVGSYVEVHGTLENNTGEEQSYVEITVTFRDEEGTRVDDTFTNFSDVEDGEKLKFEIMTTVEPGEFDEYELETSTSL